ncbi:Uncharacterised protein [Candidatus Norongarragalina meridionalis]|nr:Uncharacterised protein [Candidatus Norongarragalina meridionalis]
MVQLDETKSMIVFLVAVLLVVSVASTWLVLSNFYHPPSRNPGALTGQVTVRITPAKSDINRGVVSVNVLPPEGNST